MRTHIHLKLYKYLIQSCFQTYKILTGFVCFSFSTKMFNWLVRKKIKIEWHLVHLPSEFVDMQISFVWKVTFLDSEASPTSLKSLFCSVCDLEVYISTSHLRKSLIGPKLASQLALTQIMLVSACFRFKMRTDEKLCSLRRLIGKQLLCVKLCLFMIIQITDYLQIITFLNQ